MGMSEGVDREVESSGVGQRAGVDVLGVAATLGASGHGPQNGQPLGLTPSEAALSLLMPEELIDSPRRTRADILHARDQDPLKKGARGGGHGRVGGGGEREGQQAVKGEVEDCLTWALQ